MKRLITRLYLIRLGFTTDEVDFIQANTRRVMWSDESETFEIDFNQGMRFTGIEYNEFRSVIKALMA